MATRRPSEAEAAEAAEAAEEEEEEKEAVAAVDISRRWPWAAPHLEAASSHMWLTMAMARE